MAGSRVPPRLVRSRGDGSMQKGHTPDLTSNRSQAEEVARDLVVEIGSVGSC